jgi:hypothetical protein
MEFVIFRARPASNRLARARFVAGLLPQFIPLPNAFLRKAITKLVREHQDLPAMMRFVRKHVREYSASSRPHGHPTVAREFRDTPSWISGQRVRQHAQALFRAFPVRNGGLLDRTAVGIEQPRTLHMRRGVPDPGNANIMQVRKDRRDRSPASLLSGWRRPPRARIQPRQDQLVHRIVDRIRLYE